MPSRTAKFMPAIFAGILAGAPLTTASHGETVSADNCLSAPKGQTPPGSHWHYRIEHSTKRQCWYLRVAGGDLSQGAAQNTSPPAKPLPLQPDMTMQNSVANARAELPARTDRSDGPNAVVSVNAAGFDTSRARRLDTSAASTVVASRWPEPSGASQASSPPPATSQLAANVPANSTATPAPTVAAADSSSQSQSVAIPKLLVAVAGALVLGGMTARLTFRFGRGRHLRPRVVRARRGPIWESTDDDRIALSDYPDPDVLPRRSRFSRDVGEANGPDNRLAASFSRMPGRAPT